MGHVLGTDGRLPSFYDGGRAAVQSILLHAADEQEHLANLELQSLLKPTSQTYTGLQAFNRLCSFIEQCLKSDSQTLHDFAFSDATCESLFTLCIESTEKTQLRAMMQVLELLTSLIFRNPDKPRLEAFKASKLQKILAIITRQSAQVLIKPTLRILEHFLSKSVVSLQDLDLAYRVQVISSPKSENNECKKQLEGGILDLFILDVFHWISYPDTAPVAGKVLVAVFKEIARLLPNGGSSSSWQDLIQEGMSKYPESLEGIKNYLFPFLFKTQKPDALEFVEKLSTQDIVAALEDSSEISSAVLFLAALEVGKKQDLVDESANGTISQSETVSLPIKTLGQLLCHESRAVKSSVLNVLTLSSSPNKPFPGEILDLLREHLGVLYSDTDANLRSCVLNNTQKIIDRIRGSSSMLIRELRQDSPEATANHSSEDWIREILAPSGDGTSCVIAPTRAEEGSSIFILRQQVNFLRWYLQFLAGETFPTSSYQRRITALSALHRLLKSGILPSTTANIKNFRASKTGATWLFIINPFSKELLRLLLDLLFDPFEDVRNCASDILTFVPCKPFPSSDLVMDLNAPQNSFSFDDLPELELEELELFKKDLFLIAEKFESGVEVHNMLEILQGLVIKGWKFANNTGRADWAGGVASTNGLLYTFNEEGSKRVSFVESICSEIEEGIAIAEQDLARAIQQAPMHPRFASMRAIFTRMDGCTDIMHFISYPDLHSRWLAIQGRLLVSCQRIWNVVKHVLCDESPEGLSAAELEEMDTKDTKDIVSYSFRAILESSKLLENMLSHNKLRQAGGFNVLPLTLLEDAGSLSLIQLASIRHRGAFSAVSATFARCCVLTQDSTLNRQAGDRMLDTWYQEAMRNIFEQTSTTRRSAGIPAMLTGILSSEAVEPSFSDVISSLKAVASIPAEITTKEDTELPQVHALNCMTEVLRDTALSGRSDAYVTEALDLAVDALKSAAWAIRNSGLNLLRSLIDRISKTGDKKFFEAEDSWDGISTKIPYQRYPNLPDLILKMLDYGYAAHLGSNKWKIDSTHTVIPALDILRRGGPPEDLVDRAYSSVKKHLGSNSRDVRNLAAQVASLLLRRQSDWLASIYRLLSTNTKSSNRSEGILLLVTCLLRYPDTVEAISINQLQELVSALKENVEALEDIHTSSFVRATYENTLKVIFLLAFQKHRGSRGEAGGDSTIFEEMFLQRDIFDIAVRRIEEHGMRQFSRPALCATLDESFPLRQETALRAMSTALALEKHEDAFRILEAAGKSDSETTVKLLLLIVRTFGINKRDAKLLLPKDVPTPFTLQFTLEEERKLADTLSAVLKVSTSAEVQYHAMFLLAATIEHLAANQSPVNISWLAFKEDFEEFSNLVLTDATWQAKLRLTGAYFICDIMAAWTYVPRGEDYLQKLNYDLEIWGIELRHAASHSLNLNLRKAAVITVYSFFAALGPRSIAGPTSWTHGIMDAFFALCDFLCDDDEEIRAYAIRALKRILGSRIAGAANLGEHLLHMMIPLFKGHAPFRWEIEVRLFNDGCLSNGKPLEETLDGGHLLRLLSEAICPDDTTLFVEEEQNQFKDELQWANYWAFAYSTARGAEWNEMACEATIWCIDGIRAMLHFAEQEDGPLGWTSKPRVFAICMRIIIASRAIIGRFFIWRRYKVLRYTANRAKAERLRDLTFSRIKRLVTLMDELVRVGRNNSLHPAILHALTQDCLPKKARLP